MKADYYNEALYGLRERVLIKYSLFDLSKIKVFDIKGKFLCEAYREMPIHPMANYLGDAKDVEDLKQKTKLQKRLEAQTVKKVSALLKSEKIKPAQWQNPQELIDIKVETEQKIKQNQKAIKLLEVKEDNAIATFEHKYQRYEWLLEQSEITAEDKAWLKNYERTTEYKEIYGEESIC
jgi:putative transposase